MVIITYIAEYVSTGYVMHWETPRTGGSHPTPRDAPPLHHGGIPPYAAESHSTLHRGIPPHPHTAGPSSLHRGIPPLLPPLRRVHFVGAMYLWVYRFRLCLGLLYLWVYRFYVCLSLSYLCVYSICTPRGYPPPTLHRGIPRSPPALRCVDFVLGRCIYRCIGFVCV